MLGWIKLHRSLLDWEWWGDHNMVRLLTYLLCAVNYEQKQWMGMDVMPGTLITSYEKLSDATGLTVKQSRLCVDRLKKGKQIEVKKAGKGQAITLTKWDKLQSDDEKKAGKGQASGQAKGIERATTKESKEVKEERMRQRKLEFASTLEPFLNTYPKEMIDEFVAYWTEPNPAGTKMKFELRETWDLSRRLGTWAKNYKGVPVKSKSQAGAYE